MQTRSKPAQRDRPLARGNPYERPVFARARRMCLEFPDSTEAVAWGHPAFKAGGKMFCTFEVMGRRPSIAFRLPDKQAAAALEDVRCFASPYGRGLWVSVWMDGAVDWKQIAAFVEDSYRTVATKRRGPGQPRQQVSRSAVRSARLRRFDEPSR